MYNILHNAYFDEMKIIKNAKKIKILSIKNYTT